MFIGKQQLGQHVMRSATAGDRLWIVVQAQLVKVNPEFSAVRAAQLLVELMRQRAVIGCRQNGEGETIDHRSSVGGPSKERTCGPWYCVQCGGVGAIRLFG